MFDLVLLLFNPAIRIDYAPHPISIQATVTKYTPAETCKDGKFANCIDASGARPKQGFTVACPRAYPFNTKVIIGGHEYHCTDHLAKRYDRRFDVFDESPKRAKQWGKKNLIISVELKQYVSIISKQ